jgi:hypothetical protein
MAALPTTIAEQSEAPLLPQRYDAMCRERLRLSNRIACRCSHCRRGSALQHEAGAGGGVGLSPRHPGDVFMARVRCGWRADQLRAEPHRYHEPALDLFLVLASLGNPPRK